ncbi:hypothetical protein Tco_1254188 [Tanacetum coccineum]
MVMLVASLGDGDGTRLEEMEVRVASNEDGGGSVVWQRLWRPGVSPEMGDGAGKHSMLSRSLLLGKQLGIGYSLKDKNKAKTDKTEHGNGMSVKNRSRRRVHLKWANPYSS